MASKLTIEAIEILDTISRKGSFAAAADSLFKVPSALTYQMGKLEKDLGVALFNRSGYRATLTEAGEALLKEGRQLLEMAESVESHVKRVATGIETNIIIAINDMLFIESIYPLIAEFYKQGFGTQVKLTQEVFGGVWDAIATGRADIAIGAPSDPPIGGGYAIKTIGEMSLEFAVAPHHPLATKAEPLQAADIKPYRVVAIADSSRNLPPRTASILTGQDVLTVPNVQSKISAQIAGLGVGYVPMHVANQFIANKQLVIKQTSSPQPLIPMHLVWSEQLQHNMGQAQNWLINALSEFTIDQFITNSTN